MTKRRSGPDKDGKDGESVDEGDDGDGGDSADDGGDDDDGDSVDDGDDERLPFKMIVGESAVWTPGEYREVSCRPHRNPIFR